MDTDLRPNSAPSAVAASPAGTLLTIIPADRKARNANIKLGTERVTLTRKPSWLNLNVKWEHGPNYHDLNELMRSTACTPSARKRAAPTSANAGSTARPPSCILGDTCTRSCGFCAIKTGRPSHLDRDEPERVARSVQHLGLQHVVITSVNRDDLQLGGADIFAETIRLIRDMCPAARSRC